MSGADRANIVGNSYDKYGSRNPMARWLMKGFLGSVTELYHQARPRSVLEVGCGEGHLAQYLVTHAPRPRRFEATDLELGKVVPGLDPLLRFREASIYRLPYEDRSFDLIVCCEVLEHLAEPTRGLTELARVARHFVLLSMPREPLWRTLNIARARYLRNLGNTPGHVQHCSRAQMLELVRPFVRPLLTRSPIPWTIVLAEPR